MSKWRVIIEAWPHSTGNGADADQAAAGERVQRYLVEAEEIKGAMRLADHIAMGMLANPATWLAPITCIEKVER